ncbi:MAG TPA: TonB-dependent receptor [Bacteroidales bacterium]|nr:MAG: Vitamin B12 transporter BtuB [Bacteroidetes bacterium ADurb.Bin139]HOG24979.1 TonB-dependent receptor [Bacteroidales bacterium]HOR11008.1 TonB-dependent receptor [Bacteroidales bacterium]HOZ19131.1 TonB-dependent receptor [Bacteroidales bacterium]HPB77236.1 TonB-dependent receptor [Bacteroidales bacterium]
MKKILISLFILFPFITNAQTIRGKVLLAGQGGGTQPAAGAVVYWVPEREGSRVEHLVYTANDGLFSIPGGKSGILAASYMGHRDDTIRVSSGQDFVEFILQEDAGTLDALNITGRRQANYISHLAPVKTEVITAAGLCKMACCNLAESFENSASVSVGFTDAVTGARQIRLLGLSGNYTQMLEENRPAMRGIQVPFGLSFVPGQWLESIQIAKGTGSVVNGCEAITGQINMEFRKPTTELPLFVNLFLNDALRTEANVASSLQLNDRWSTVVLAHGSADLMRHDSNGDGFMDEPLTNRYSLANRWLYSDASGLQLRFGFRGLYEDRKSGEMDNEWVLPGQARDNAIWGSRIINKGVNAYVKLGIPLVKHDHAHDHAHEQLPTLDHEAGAANGQANVHGGDYDHEHEPAQAQEDESHIDPNIALVLDYNLHKQNAYFGLKDYNAMQSDFFANAIFMSSLGKHHKITAGVSALVENLDQVLTDRWAAGGEESFDLGRKEGVYGAYGEYTLEWGDKLVFIAGARADYNTLYGWLFTPGVNLRYNFTDNLVFRANAGRGYRTPYSITDHIGVLSTGRRILFEETPEVEEAWTYGLNLTLVLPFGHGGSSTLSLEYFRTNFMNQLIADQEYLWDAEIPSILLYNLQGRSYTNTWQADFTTEPFDGFSVLATFRYNDSKVDLKGLGLVDRPLTSKFKGVLNLQYTTPRDTWVFDVTGQINGPARIPSFATDTEDKTSPVFPMFYAQVTRKFRNLDIYIGGENLLNYRQPDPIISADDPFSSHFNASLIWGPLMGIRVYAGIRLSLFR